MDEIITSNECISETLPGITESNVYVYIHSIIKMNQQDNIDKSFRPSIPLDPDREPEILSSHSQYQPYQEQRGRDWTEQLQRELETEMSTSDQRLVASQSQQPVAYAGFSRSGPFSLGYVSHDRTPWNIRPCEQPTMRIETGESCRTDTKSNTKQAGKRKRQPELWKKNVRKKLRQKGQEYINTRGAIVPERTLLDIDCTTCPYKCSQHFDQNARQEIFSQFWSLTDEEKSSFYLKYTQRLLKQRVRTNAEKSRRDFTMKYFLQFKGVRKRVCKRFFLATLAISSSRVNNVYRQFDGVRDQGKSWTFKEQGHHSKRSVTQTNEGKLLGKESGVGMEQTGRKRHMLKKEQMQGKQQIQIQGKEQKMVMEQQTAVEKERKKGNNEMEGKNQTETKGYEELQREQMQEMKQIQKGKGQGFKRKRQPELWAKNVQKEMRQKGKAFVNSKGKVMPERTMQFIDCSDCVFKCSQHFDNYARLEIFSEFWSMSHDEKLMFYSEYTQRVPKQRVRTAVENSRRDYTFLYYLEIEGMKHRVCKKFFLATLDISSSRINNFHKQMTESGFIKRKRQAEVCKTKIPEHQVMYAKEHILSFPIVASHYCCTESTRSRREYLDHRLNLTSMYKLYEKKCEEEGKSPIKLHKYRQIFNEFNMGFMKQKSNDDSCEKCGKPKYDRGEPYPFLVPSM